jgi:hypothetical protein
VLFGVASFLFFPVAIGVNDQQGENNQAADSDNDDDGLVTPHIAYKIRNVRTHTFLIYTIFVESEMHVKTLVAFVVPACSSSRFTSTRPMRRAGTGRQTVKPAQNC